MQIPPRVSFRDVDPYPELEAEILERVRGLERFYDRIIGCRVVVSVPHRRHRKGRLYDVRIDLSVPGEEIVVSREDGPDPAHADPRIAVRDAFKAARRELVDHVRRMRDRAKPPAAPTSKARRPAGPPRRVASGRPAGAAALGRARDGGRRAR